MASQITYVIIVILLLVLLLCIINRKNEIKEVVTEGFQTIHKIKDYLKNNSTEDIFENFASNSWTKTEIEAILEEEGLNKKQYGQVSNMINAISKSTLQDLVTQQSPLLTGPMGPPGQQGPPGTTLIASGRLINKDSSREHPKHVVTRTEGTNENTSLSFMDDSSSFASFQDWQLNVNNNLVNRYDNSCLTMGQNQDNLYMSNCDPNNNGQKWTWDSSNRIISTSASTDKLLKCIGLSKDQINSSVQNVPGCVEEKCNTNTPRRFLQIKDCQINSIQPDELWDFT
jgi:hypothetical protein